MLLLEQRREVLVAVVEGVEFVEAFGRAVAGFPPQGFGFVDGGWEWVVCGGW